ncbi:MAG: xenobiotic-transporting ATPase [Acidobacteria bacterium 13_2_20CM_2_57_6]|nr:MAG: xenobiotic-transporting ATPase [Acidobacteria bacterium 13_2_20CM_2_57_6]
MTIEQTSSNRDLALYLRLFRWARPYWTHLIGLFLLSLLATPLALLVPLPLKIALDSGLDSKPLPHLIRTTVPAGFRLTPSSALLFAVGLLIVVTILAQIQTLAVALLKTYTGEKVLLEFRSGLFGQMQRLSLSYHDVKGTAESLYNVQYDAAAVQAVLAERFIPLIGSAFTLLGMLYVTMKIDWQLALVALLISPILFLISKFYRRRLRRGAREVKKLEKSAMGVVQEVLGALRVVKAFGKEEDERHRFVRRSFEGMRARLKLALAEGKYNFLVGLTSAIGTATVLFVGFRQVQSGVITLGDLMLMMGYVSLLYEPLKSMGKNSAALQSYMANIERAFALLDELPEVAEKTNPRSLVRATGKIAFRNVSFRYGQNRPALEQVAFEVDAGICVGIVGTTGAGKTTLVNLLTRFYDPTEGQISLDGVDLRDYKLKDLRNQFAIVLQESVLFSTSLAENIAYARPNASEAEIVAAAKAANAHEFISNLPEGYQTLVGDRGMRLSGGERQRISIARAFLKDAPILILDEPTSSVDVRTESLILEAMERLAQGRTTLVITHRPSALKQCDVIVRIEKGRLAAIESIAGGQMIAVVESPQ